MGYPKHSYDRLTGPFKKLIVGNYLYMFGIITIVIIQRVFNYNLIYNYIILILLSIITFLSGERNSFLGSLFVLGLLFIFYKKKRILTLLTIASVLIICFTISLNDQKLKHKYIFLDEIIFNLSKHFYTKENKELFNKKNEILTVDLKKSEIEPWLAHYRIAQKIFENNKIFGSGFHTFRYECQKYDNRKDLLCNTHPHNLYLEILSDLGLCGLIGFLFVIILIFYRVIKKKTFLNNFSNSLLFSLFILNIFPFKVHGSIFSTTTAFYFWTSLGLLQSLLFNNKKNYSNLK
jgi:O-antigen ligase